MEEQNLTKKQRRELKKQEKLNQQAKDARRRRTRSVLIWLIVLFVLAAVVWLVTISGQGDPENNLTPSEIVQTRSADAHIKGNPDAQVSLVEFSDFQCPACAYYRGFLDDIVKDLGDYVSVEYRHFPLKQIHPNSVLSAQAAEAAALQGKFWEMHDIIFIKQSEWKDLSSNKAREKFIEYAESIGLDKDKFSADIDSETVKDKVREDEKQAFQLGLNSTPSIFINGLKINNPSSYAEFRKIVESEVNWNK